MLAENATGLRNLFKLSSLASFEGQLGKWSRMDAELIAEHAAGIIATTGCPSGEVQTRLRLGQYRRGAGGGRQVAGHLRARQLLPRADGPRPGHRAAGPRGAARRSAASSASRRWPPTTATTSPATPAHNHEALLCVQTGKTLADPNRFKFDGDGYYLKSAAEMRQLWDDDGARRPATATLLIAERVQSYADVFEPRDRMPVFPVPDGTRPGVLAARTRWTPGWAGGFPAGPTGRLRGAGGRVRDRRHLRQWASRPTSWSSPT